MKIISRRNYANQHIVTIGGVMVGYVFYGCLDDYGIGPKAIMACVVPSRVYDLGKFSPHIFTASTMTRFRVNGILCNKEDEIIQFDNEKSAVQAIKELLSELEINEFDDTWHKPIGVKP